jgi:putative ABC transport system permease protein
MSLVFTIASRNLFQDRVRFVASLIGIVLSVVLVMVQIGLYFGFTRMITTVIDHAQTDLWIVGKGAKSFEDLSLLGAGTRDKLLAINGVADAVPVVVGFSAWMVPDGTMTPVFIIGSDSHPGGLSPWNIVEGSISDLAAPGTVAIDRSYYNRLGVKDVGVNTQIRGLPVTVGVITDGIRSFTTTPYVFADLGSARSYIGLPASFVSHFLVRLAPGAKVDQVRQNIISEVAGVQALTPDQFRNQSRSFWLFETGAGAALFAGALLSVIVGTAIVAQTLYSSTKEHLYEFATLRAMGATNAYIYKVIISQALIDAVIGFCIAAIIGILAVHFTSKTALQIVITHNLMLASFLLTVVMCVASAIAATLRVIRLDPVMVLSQ